MCTLQVCTSPGHEAGLVEEKNLEMGLIQWIPVKHYIKHFWFVQVIPFLQRENYSQPCSSCVRDKDN
jgi:hypothetical protein